MNVKFSRSIVLTIGILALVGCWKSIGDTAERENERRRLLKVVDALYERGNEHTGDVIREILALHKSPREETTVVRRAEATGEVGECIVLYEDVKLGIGPLPIIAEVWKYEADFDPIEQRNYTVLIIYSTGDFGLQFFNKKDLLSFLAIEDPEEAADWLYAHR